MNKILLTFIILPILSVLVFVTCTEENSTNPPVQETPNYFPHNEGTFFKYEFTQTDSNGIVETGFLTTTFLEDTTINRTPYQKQVDSIQTNLQTTISNKFFRTTETGVFYFADTTGFISSLPDSLRSSVEIQDEMRTLLFPLEQGSAWTVYRISIAVNEFLSFSPVDITGRFVSDEQLTLNLFSGDTTVNAKKVDYILKLTTQPGDSAQTFSASSWVAENIGIVKIEGNSIISSFLSGGGLAVTDTSSIVSQKLIEFKIK